MVVRFKQLRAEGKNIGQACKAVGISRPLFHIYRNRIKVWKEGTVWPPPEPSREELARAGAPRKRNPSPLIFGW